MVIWSIPARNDLKQIYDYIAKDSKYYATNGVQILAIIHGKQDFSSLDRDDLDR